MVERESCEVKGRIEGEEFRKELTKSHVFCIMYLQDIFFRISWKRN
jgi:hypothetical protein